MSGVKITFVCQEVVQRPGRGLVALLKSEVPEGSPEGTRPDSEMRLQVPINKFPEGFFMVEGVSKKIQVEFSSLD